MVDHPPPCRRSLEIQADTLWSVMQTCHYFRTKFHAFRHFLELEMICSLSFHPMLLG